MLKKLLYFLAAGLIVAGLLAPPAHTQTSGNQSATLARVWDLDGESDDDDQVITAANGALTDSATFTLTANPDIPRPLIATITDANSSISAGVITIVGTLANGQTVTATVTIAGGGSTTIATVPAYNFATVTSVTSGVLTGEDAGDTIKLGVTTATIPYLYPAAYGRKFRDSQDTNRTDPFEWAQLSVLEAVETSGSSTTVAAVSASTTAPFTLLAVGDILMFKRAGDIFERAITAKASADSVTVDTAVNLDVDGGVGFLYKKMLAGPDAEDGWIPVGALRSARWTVNIAQMNGTGGIDTKVECRIAQGLTVVLLSDNSTAAEVVDFAIDFDAGGPADQCRLGIQWATNDDATDTTTAQEQISISFSGVRR